MRLFYSEDEPEGEAEDEDEEKTKAAVATAFGLATSVFRARRITDNFWKQNNTEKEKLQLDIAALRMQVTICSQSTAYDAKILVSHVVFFLLVYSDVLL